VNEHGDPGYLRFRRGTVKLASAASVIAATMVAAYALATWETGQNRDLLAALAVGVWLSVAVINLARAERLVETRWCDLFFGCWSALYVITIAGLALLDGGSASPLIITFFAPLVFAGTCYPLRLAVYVGIAVVAAFLAISLMGPRHEVASALYVAGLLALVAGMCAWQAHLQEQGRRELARVSRTDPLTGTLNRRGFGERVEAELARADRSGEPVALVLVDLDGFKHVNDARGHAAGDALLRWVADTLRRGLRPSDAAGRLGGDEFALLLPGIDAVGAREVAERVRLALRVRTSASFGVADFPTRRDAEALLAHADAELYLEKPGARSALFELALEVPDSVWY
jgi:diguanylate cyclase (GGDEF)-like protein